jgi:transcriptional regulator with XRE-family HTH domain
MPSKSDAAPATFGKRLRALRADSGLSAAELAQRAGLSRPYLSRLEADGSSPTWDVVVRLAGILECRPDDFL